jgi:hypothetical protein
MKLIFNLLSSESDGVPTLAGSLSNFLTTVIKYDHMLTLYMLPVTTGLYHIPTYPYPYPILPYLPTYLFILQHHLYTYIFIYIQPRPEQLVHL